MNSHYDKDVDAYYFSNEGADSAHASVQQIPLGMREVYIDVDVNGTILGVEVF